MTILLPVRFSAIHKNNVLKPLIYKAFQHLLLSILRKSLIFLDFCQIYYFFKKSTSQTLINRAFQKAIKPNFYGYNFPKGCVIFHPQTIHILLFKMEFYEFVICMFLFITSPSDRQICLKKT